MPEPEQPERVPRWSLLLFALLPWLLPACFASRPEHARSLHLDPPVTVSSSDPLPPVEPIPEVAAALRETPPSRLSLEEAVAFALQNNPRLRAALANIDRARGQEQAAFAPFLPQFDLFNRYVATSPALSPGAPGPTGGLLTDGPGPYSAWQTELQLQWTLYDFGRTGSRYQQAVLRAQIAGWQAERARQTVAYDAATAFLQGLHAAALRTIARDAVRQAEAVLNDTRQRRAAGVAERDDVPRGEVQRAEMEDSLVRAEETELAALARLNNVLGRDASLPLELLDAAAPPRFERTLADCLERAVASRPEVAAARDRIAVAQFGRQAARGEFLPRVSWRASLGHASGDEIRNGWQRGTAIHIDMPLYHGGTHVGELRAAEADIRQAAAEAQVILDSISLEVTLAYRAVVSARARSKLARPAVVQSRETLRIVRNRYRNGTATPTDVIDAETARTRAEQRLVSASIDFRSALARLAYAIGCAPDELVEPDADGDPEAPEQLPPPRQLPEGG
ncbi:MAG: TolC family protein [Planctomycetia bacterium]|nr:TolC family protein [Planctomycetia bacterium]